MAYLRKCYSTWGRAYKDGPLVRIWWYWAFPDAIRYAKGHCWEPAFYSQDKVPYEDHAGEQPLEWTRPRDGNPPPWAENGGNPCGTEDDFMGLGIPPLVPSGVDFFRLCGCDHPPKIAFGIRSYWKRHFVADLAIQGQGVQADYAAAWMAFTGRGDEAESCKSALCLEGHDAEEAGTEERHGAELVMEGHALEAFEGGSALALESQSAEASSTAGELVMEGRAGEYSGSGERAAAELVMEGQAGEYNESRDTAAGELVMEGQAGEYNESRDTAAGELVMEGRAGEYSGSGERSASELVMEGRAGEYNESRDTAASEFVMEGQASGYSGSVERAASEFVMEGQSVESRTSTDTAASELVMEGQSGDFSDSGERAAGELVMEAEADEYGGTVEPPSGSPVVSELATEGEITEDAPIPGSESALESGASENQGTMAYILGWLTGAGSLPP